MRKASLLLLVVFLSTPVLRAEALRLSLSEAIDQALTTGTQAQLARSGHERAQIARREALGAMLPQADARLVRSNESVNLATFGFAPPGVPPVVGPFNVTDAQLSAAMQLFNVAALRRYQALQRGEQASALDTQAADNEVIAAVARLYVFVQRADAQVASRRADIALMERLLRLAEDEFTAGTGTRLDTAQQHLQLERARHALLVAEYERRTAALALLNAIGADESADVVAVDPLPHDIPTVGADEALADARQNRPELRALSLHEDEARLNWRAQQARRLPSVSAAFQGDFSGNHRDDLRWTRQISGVLSLPLFRTDIQAGIARARIDLLDAQLRREQLERDVEQEVRRGVLAVEGAKARVAVAAEGARVAEEALTIARDRRAAGYGSPVEVDRAEDAYRQAREDLITAQADAAAGGFELQRATGRIEVLHSGRQK